MAQITHELQAGHNSQRSSVNRIRVFGNLKTSIRVRRAISAALNGLMESVWKPASVKSVTKRFFVKNFMWDGIVFPSRRIM